MEIWNPYKFTNAKEVVTFLILIVLIAMMAGMKNSIRQYKRSWIFMPVLVFWIFTIFSATYFGRMESEEGRVRLDLFWTIQTAWVKHSGLHWYYIIGNILLFLPLGFLLPLASRHINTVAAVTLSGAVLSLLIELLQLLTATGLCELDDLFHNTLGTFTGYQLFMIFCHIFNVTHGREQRGERYYKATWGLSLFYIIGICLFFAISFHLNKPDWTGVFY